MTPSFRHIEVVPSPKGGFTIAVPLAGSTTARIHVGLFDTRRDAARFAVRTPDEQLEAMASALVQYRGERHS